MAQCLTHLEIQSPWDVCVFDFLIEEHLVILRISSFACNPRQNSPYFPFPGEQTHTHTRTHTKKTWLPSWGWRDGPLNPPQVVSSRVGCVGSAKWKQWSVGLSQANICYPESPASKTGRAGDAQRGPEEEMSWAVGEKPLVCRVVRLNESHHCSVGVCQEPA